MTSASTKRTRRHVSNNLVITLCMLVTIMEGCNLIVYGAVVPLLLESPELALNEETVGFIGGVVYLGALLGAVSCTPLADRFGQQVILTASAATFAAGALISSLAPSAVVLGLSRVITGLGVGGAITMALTIARNHAPARRVSLVVTIAMAGVPLGGTIASILGTTVMPVYGWRVMFLLGLVLTLPILVALMITKIEETSEVIDTTMSAGQKFKLLFVNGGYRIVILIALAAITNMATWLGLNVWLAQAMAGLGFELQAALMFVFVLTAAAVVGSFVIAYVADNVGSAKMAIVCTLTTLLGLLLLLWGPSAAVLAVVAVALMGIGGHSTQNLIVATASSVVAPHSRGTIFSVVTSMAFIGSFAGPAIGGLAFAQGGSLGVLGIYAVIASCCAILCTALYMLHRRLNRSHEVNSQVNTAAVLSGSPVPEQ